MKSITFALVLAAALLAEGTASAAGISEGTMGYGHDCWYSGSDADNDNVNDDCEAKMAYWWMPKIWFDSGESGSGRHAHFSVKNVSYASRTLQIFFMNAYYDDTGILTGHDGDPEFQVFEVFFDGSNWLLQRVYMSAHRDSICDSSAWYSYSQLQYDYGYRAYPTIYAAEDKHATYNSASTCDAGCGGLDYCSQYFWQWEDYSSSSSSIANRNMGQSWNQMRNRIYHNGEHEDLWDDEHFEGWDDNWYRFDSNGYRSHTDDFGF